MQNTKRPLIKIADIFIIAAICVIAVLLLIFNTAENKNPVAVITVDGEVYQRIDLATAKNQIITLHTSPVVTLEIKDSAIAFVNSRCPDGTCEKSGYLENAGDTAACVPAGTVVSIEGNNPQVDAVAG